MKGDKCKICGRVEGNNYDSIKVSGFNIEFGKENICEHCADSITMQQTLSNIHEKWAKYKAPKYLFEKRKTKKQWRLRT